jgi:hypothetical protein
MQHDSTLDALKNFWMTSKTVIQWVNHVLLKGRNTKCFRVKANKTTIIPSKISSVYECKPSHSFPDLSSLKFFEHEWTKQHVIQKSQHQTLRSTSCLANDSLWHVTFPCIQYSSNHTNYTMITDQNTVKRSLSKQSNSRSPTSNHLYPRIEQSDLSSLNLLNKNEHYKSASETNNNMVTKTRPRSTAKLR